MTTLRLAFARPGARPDPEPTGGGAYGRPGAIASSFTAAFTAASGDLAVAGPAGALAIDPHNRVALALDGRVDVWGPQPPPAGTSDAKHLLQRYLERGEAFLDGITGSYVVALLDDRAPLALLARDALGNRYASYSLDSETFRVDSEDAALLRWSGVAGDLDPLRLTEFYAVEELSGDETLFQSVRALLPGELIVVERSQVRKRFFDRIEPARRLTLPSWEEYVEAFAERLQRAVQRRMRGVARAAVWLSGGLDSGPIAAIAAQRDESCRNEADLVGLCWKVGNAAGDEIEWARSVGELAGFRVESVDCEDALPYSSLATWPVRDSTPDQTAYRRYHDRSYERARELGCDTVFWGFGGDMLYAAPRRWFWDLLAASGPGPAIDRLRAAAAERGWRRVVRSELLAPVLRPARDSIRPAPAWMTSAARERLERRPDWPPGRDRARRPHQARRLLALLDAFGVSVERADAARFGLELQTPLRDRDLVEFALAVPDHLLFQGDETRPVLRAAVRGLLPEKVRLRRGKGRFSAAVEIALRPENRPWAAPLLEHPDALWRGQIEPTAIARWLERCPTGDADDVGFCQAIYGELWRRKRAGEDLGALDPSTV